MADLDDVMLHLDLAEAAVRNAKRALRPESLASEPDMESLLLDIRDARRELEQAFFGVTPWMRKEGGK